MKVDDHLKEQSVDAIIGGGRYYPLKSSGDHTGMRGKEKRDWVRRRRKEREGDRPPRGRKMKVRVSKDKNGV